VVVPGSGQVVGRRSSNRGKRVIVWSPDARCAFATARLRLPGALYESWNLLIGPLEDHGRLDALPDVLFCRIS
jgi:hypothetical protein